MELLISFEGRTYTVRGRWDSGDSSTGIREGFEIESIDGLDSDECEALKDDTFFQQDCTQAALDQMDNDRIDNLRNEDGGEDR